jgi:arsenate reductase
MHKIYYLKTCDTCSRILKTIPTEKFEMIEIKSQPISVNQLEEMYNLSGSYEALFSRRAKKYHQMDLKNQELTEKDYRRLLLDEYTFLKRPIIIIDKKIFIGNSKKNVTYLIQESANL